jgi:nitrogen-specific signal transduction histidine kinase
MKKQSVIESATMKVLNRFKDKQINLYAKKARKTLAKEIAKEIKNSL